MPVMKLSEPKGNLSPDRNPGGPELVPARDQAESVSGLETKHPWESKIIRFSDLAGSQGEIWISHEEQVYRLGKTRNGKLVLSK